MTISHMVLNCSRPNKARDTARASVTARYAPPPCSDDYQPPELTVEHANTATAQLPST